MADEQAPVMVGCRIPGGVRLRTYVPGREGEPMRAAGHPFDLKGPSGVAAGASNPSPMGEVLFTPVDPGIWAAWLEQNREHAWFTDGLIFVQGEDPQEKPDDGHS